MFHSNTYGPNKKAFTEPFSLFITEQAALPSIGATSASNIVDWLYGQESYSFVPSDYPAGQLCCWRLSGTALDAYSGDSRGLDRGPSLPSSYILLSYSVMRRDGALYVCYGDGGSTDRGPDLRLRCDWQVHGE